MRGARARSLGWVGWGGGGEGGGAYSGSVLGKGLGGAPCELPGQERRYKTGRPVSRLRVQGHHLLRQSTIMHATEMVIYQEVFLYILP